MSIKNASFNSFEFLPYYNYTLEETFVIFEYIANYIHRPAVFDHLDDIYRCFKTQNIRNFQELLPFILSKSNSNRCLQKNNVNKSIFSLLKYWIHLICPENKKLINLTRGMTGLSSLTQKLIETGIFTTFTLLEQCKTQKGFNKLISEHELDRTKVEKLVKFADIDRIHSRDVWVKGLMKLGYSTCHELAQEDEDQLMKKLLEGKHIPKEKYTWYVTRS